MKPMDTKTLEICHKFPFICLKHEARKPLLFRFKARMLWWKNKYSTYRETL